MTYECFSPQCIYMWAEQPPVCVSLHIWLFYSYHIQPLAMYFTLACRAAPYTCIDCLLFCIQILQLHNTLNNVRLLDQLM